jgi:hypothetical protein
VEDGHLADAQDGPKAQHEAPHRREAGTLLFQSVDRLRLAGAQERARLSEQGPGNLGDTWRTGVSM